MATTNQEHRVVLVDDTRDLRELLRMALERHEFVVVGEGADGREGIEAVRTHSPDLVLLDLAMPEMDGLQALPVMREACPTAKIVVLSGFGASQMTREALAIGADGYLQKGAALNRIIDYVRGIVNGSPSKPPQAVTIIPRRDDPPDRPG